MLQLAVGAFEGFGVVAEDVFSGALDARFEFGDARLRAFGPRFGFFQKILFQQA